MDVDLLTGLATVALAVVTGVSAYFLYRQLKVSANESKRQATEAALQTREAKERNDQAKKEATIQFYASTLSPRSAWQEGLPDDRDVAGVRAYIRELDEATVVGVDPRRALVHSYLSYWELIAAGVRNDVLDGAVLRRLVRTRVIRIAAGYSSFIDEEAARLGYEPGVLYEELRRLASSWNDGTR